MKRGLNILALLTALLLTFSLSACRAGTFGRDSTQKYSASFDDENVIVPESYGKRYAVESVDLNVAAGGGELEPAAAVDKVYTSTVTIHAGVSGGTQIGSGTIVDIDVKYKDKTVDTADFVYVVTCHHVIEGSNNIAVYIPKVVDAAADEYDYYEYGFAATLMGGDKKSDLAVLRIEIVGHEGISADTVTKAQICGDDLQIGDEIFLLGNPVGTHPGSYSAGSVSRAFVEVSVEEIGTMKLMQTDAAANHGNSGGGVYNFAGQFVGVLNSGLNLDSDGEPVQGLGFFIPVNGESGVEKVADSLISTVTDEAYGYVEGRWMLGVTLQSALGGYVLQVANLSGNETDTVYATGIVKGDYIFEVSYVYNGETVACDMASLSAFSEFFETMQQRLTIGDEITVKYGRNPRGSGAITDTVAIRQHIYTI